MHTICSVHQKELMTKNSYACSFKLSSPNLWLVPQDGYERLLWVLLTPEAGGPAGGTEAANLVLEAYLKLLNLGHLTAWRVVSSDDTRRGGGVVPSEPFQHTNLKEALSSIGTVLNMFLCLFGSC